jgi:hypothetical protein
VSPGASNWRRRRSLGSGHGGQLKTVFSQKSASESNSLSAHNKTHSIF